jgi:hypothetical protein
MVTLSEYRLMLGSYVFEARRVERLSGMVEEEKQGSQQRRQHQENSGKDRK